MEIERTTFGTITIDGKTYEHDVIIRLSGEVARRKKKLSKKYYGTSHVLSKDEAKFVFENGCEQLILGSGQMGNVHLSPEAEAYFAKKSCAVLLQPTPQGDSYVQQLACEEGRPFSRYLLNWAGRDCAAADEQKPESALRTSIGRTLVRADRRRKPPSSRFARGPDRAEPNVRTDVSGADQPRVAFGSICDQAACPRLVTDQ